jgi:7-cyano-7-deazaguanine synthase
MDSTALAAWLRPEIAFTINYGQRSAAGELRAAAAVCEELSIKHEVVTVDCARLGSGDLAGTPPISVAPIPEWWPYRNQLLITVAAMRAIAADVTTLLLGTVASDRQHTDGTPEFVSAISDLLAFQEGNLRVEAPAINMSSAELVRRSGISRSVLAWAHSCHVDEFACGNCRGCYKHREVTAELWGEGY